MRLPLPRFTPIRLMVAVEIAAVVVWLWACRFAGLDDEEATTCVILGIGLGFPILGISALVVLALHAFPNDFPPPESTASGGPQFTIGCLMSAITISAITLALICLG